MVIYRRKKGSDVWHWCKNCSNWPEEDYEEIDLPLGKRPSNGELDDQCLAKEKKGDCKY